MAVVKTQGNLQFQLNTDNYLKKFKEFEEKRVKKEQKPGGPNIIYLTCTCLVLPATNNSLYWDFA